MNNADETTSSATDRRDLPREKVSGTMCVDDYASVFGDLHPQELAPTERVIGIGDGRRGCSKLSYDSRCRSGAVGQAHDLVADAAPARARSFSYGIRGAAQASVHAIAAIRHA